MRGLSPAVKVLDKLISQAAWFSVHNRTPEVKANQVGKLVEQLSPEDRENLQSLTEDDIKNRNCLDVFYLDRK